MRETAISVVTGVIVRDGLFLLTQRGRRSDFAFHWESPGGKVEPGEAPRDALRRELEEEVAWRGGTISWLPFWETTFSAHEIGRRAPVTISFFACQAGSGWAPRMSCPNVVGLGWFGFEEIAHLDLIPGNRRLWDHMALAGLSAESL